MSDAAAVKQRETAVKICGLQSVEVLKSMVNLPVDYVGFVFAPSKRQIDGARAAELLPVLREWSGGERPQSVGVFVNPSIEELAGIIRQAPLDILQAARHGKPGVLPGGQSGVSCENFQSIFRKTRRIGSWRTVLGSI